VKRMSGAEILVESLRKEGVDTIFGYPGGVVLGIFDTLYDAPIRIVLTRHEQAAAHAADGYARVSGKVGVCMTTSGPGATNLVTGIATAHMDSVPIVALTGQVATPLIGGDAFQEADITGITRPITKHNYLVKDVRDLARVIKEAFHIAPTGRPGPVLIDLPKDVTTDETVFKYPKAVELRGYKPKYEGHPRQIKRAVQEIAKAERPVIYAGGGMICSGASRELAEFARKTQIPVTLTLLGLGAFPASDPLFMGMLGMHGTKCANSAVSGCDLLIAIGARFDDRVTGKIEKFAPDATIIHIDIDPSAISKNVVVDLPIVGDVKNILSELTPLVKKCKTSQWLKQIAKWKKEFPLTYDRKANTIKPQYVVEQIYEATEGKAIIATEVGQNQMWAAQYYKFEKPRHFLSSGGLGTMGYGFPAAIGAQIACPDKLVFDIAGDGSFQMNIQELATVTRLKLPVKVAILNNQFLGMVRQWQDMFYGKRYSSSCLADNPDFAKVAEAFGATGIKVTKKRDVRPAIDKAIETPGPVVLDFAVDREENVMPMVPAGAAISDMIMEA
jgi:acetolactate synthase-1/2/3 large subunit